MSNELIERLAASPVVYREQRVITLRMMDELHERAAGTARRNFNANKTRLTQDVDYFELNQPDEIRSVGLGREDGGTPARIVLLAESGYLLLVKSFTDDLAWKVQRALVAVYFRARQDHSGDVLLDGLKSLVLLRESQIVLERRTAEATQLASEAKHLAQAVMAKVEANHGCFSILGFARLRNMEMPVSEASKHGKKLTAMCAERGIEIQRLTDPRFGIVNTYPESILEEYFGAENS